MRKNNKYTKELFLELLTQTRSMADLLTQLGLKPVGGNYRIMNRRLANFEINPDVYWGDVKKRMGWLKGKTHNFAKSTPLEDILVKGFAWGGGTNKLKNKLLEQGYFERKCYSCNNSEWLGKPIALELEHINGDSFDNTIENLTILCPNCHAQTDTYRGKNKGKKASPHPI